ncbi:hypothetical protein D3C71_1194390 [compost metagenome]
MRLLQHLTELREEILAEPQPLEIKHHRFAVEQTHHHALAVRGRHGADPQVQLLALHAQHDAAVLRQTTLGDVELGHDLDAADHRSGEVHRRAFAIDQHAIDAVTHLQAILERFDMDVGRAQFHRTLDQQVHQADDRRFGGQIAQMLDVIQRRGFAVGRFQDGPHRAAALAVPALDHFIHFAAQANDRRHFATGGQRDGLARVGILRVSHPQAEAALMFAQWQHQKLFEKTQRHRFGAFDQLRRLLGQRARGEQAQAQHLGAGLGVVTLGHQPEPGQQHQQIACGLLVHLPGTQQIGLLEAALGQQLGDDAVSRRGCSLGVVGCRVHAILL